jgi:RNA polymerase sigma factor (TIGR02999 family)
MHDQQDDPTTPGAVPDAAGRAAVDEMVPFVYDELRRVAAAYLRGEHAAESLQPTALVHEAYLRLAQLERMKLQSPAHLLSLAAQQMRRILVDHARTRNAAKRGGEFTRIELDDSVGGVLARDADLIALDRALDELARTDERLGRVVELRYFGGLTLDETAKVLSVSTATVEREWAAARAWLRRAIRREAE